MTSRRSVLLWWVGDPGPVRSEGESGRLESPGRVVIDRRACLNTGADFCATCVERCPVPGAIRLDGRHPAVLAACTGCGVCVPLCPAPGGAMMLSGGSP
jgi:Pyruvate/2-oxoacid:ferredoxin oxidoreductase delta subunit